MVFCSLKHVSEGDLGAKNVLVLVSLQLRYCKFFHECLDERLGCGSKLRETVVRNETVTSQLVLYSGGRNAARHTALLTPLPRLLM